MYTLQLPLLIPNTLLKIVYIGLTALFVPTAYEESYFPSIISIALTSFKHPKLPISIKIPFILLQIVYICLTAISPNSSS